MDEDNMNVNDSESVIDDINACEPNSLGTDTFLGEDSAQVTEEIPAEDKHVGFMELLRANAAENAPDIYAENDYKAEYKEKMKELKKEYKKQKKAEKAARRAESDELYGETPSKPHIGLTILISSLVTLLICAIVFVLLLVVPNTQNSFFAHLCKKYTITARDRYPSQPSQKIGDNTIEPGSNITIQVEGDSSVEAVYAKAANSVVGVEVRALSGQKWEQQTETVISQGSGIVYSEDGQILTNYHVISDAMNTNTRAIASNYKVVVYFDTSLSEEYEVVNVIGYDESCDIALLKVEAEGLTPVEFGDSDELAVGETVIAIGSPGGLEFMNSVSEGVISGLQRNITSSSTGNTIYDLIQTTTAINPGNSGGALLNTKGELVGVCVIKIVDSSYEGMGFAISSNTAKMIAESILKYGRYVKAMLGVSVNTAYNKAAADKSGWPAGAYVAEVEKDSPASRAGFRADDIICELDGIRVNSYDDLRRLLTHYSPEDSVNVKLYRSSTDEYIDTTVVLGAS